MVKKAITVGKALGGIPPEVLNRCNLDDIILDYANKLIDGEKSNQWSESSFVTIPKDGDLRSKDGQQIYSKQDETTHRQTPPAQSKWV